MSIFSSNTADLCRTQSFTSVIRFWMHNYMRGGKFSAKIHLKLRLGVIWLYLACQHVHKKWECQVTVLFEQTFLEYCSLVHVWWIKWRRSTGNSHDVSVNLLRAIAVFLQKNEHKLQCIDQSMRGLVNNSVSPNKLKSTAFHDRKCAAHVRRHSTAATKWSEFCFVRNKNNDLSNTFTFQALHHQLGSLHTPPEGDFFSALVGQKQRNGQSAYIVTGCYLKRGNDLFIY